MKDIKIIFLKELTQELFECDYSGRIIQQENSLNIGLIIPISFKIDNGNLNSLLKVWVPKKNLPSNHYKEFIVSLMIELFSKYIQNINYFNAFEAIDYSFLLSGKYKMNKYENIMRQEVDVVISNELFDHLVKQKEEDRITRDAFEFATKILYGFCDLSTYGFEC
jgi:hypothetical protein